MGNREAVSIYTEMDMHNAGAVNVPARDIHSLPSRAGRTLKPSCKSGALAGMLSTSSS